MHIVVCVKQVPDWDIPPSSFKIDESLNQVVSPPGVAAVPSQFDTIGVEAAMRLKDEAPDTKVTIMSLGPETARDAIKHSLAMGADEGVLLTDALFENLDWYQVSLVPVGALMLYQQHLIKERDPQGCFRAFLNNAWAGGIVFAGVGLAYLL